MIYIGFDTSNYTTSVACCGGSNISLRRILNVKQGERGLRQSDALFQHIKNMPDMFEELCRKAQSANASAVGVSIRPRNADGSYMPVFLAGEGYARVCAAALGVPVYNFSHQDGHIMAGITSARADFLLYKPFISVHLSGGTCEILRTRFNGKGFDVEIVGGTKDISAGQLIDRVGVALGLKFPAGAELEKLAKKAESYCKLPINSKDGYINFSGIETKSLSLVGVVDDAQLSLGVFYAAGNAVAAAVRHCCHQCGIKDVLIVGGVAANGIIKRILENETDADVYFASPEYSTDNAYGVAKLTQMRYRME